ncbi:MAG TPA: hypothetical protein PLM24_03025 [Methanothrix sp.]|nr:hypothetical protein [Methanothrix sp.]HPJ83808.1 hypothetical protein [Methanothrix sp.]HPR66088.1 hypothetical protein [Methanothrix sp.]
MTDLAVMLLVTEGVALSAFVYYLDHKRRMYLLEKGISKEEPPDARLESRLLCGLFLLLSGIALIASPNIARIAGLEVSLTFGLLIMGILAVCSGLAMILGYCILKRDLPCLAD